MDEMDCFSRWPCPVDDGDNVDQDSVIVASRFDAYPTINEEWYVIYHLSRRAVIDRTKVFSTTCNVNSTVFFLGKHPALFGDRGDELGFHVS